MADFGSGRTTKIPYLSVDTMDDHLPDAPQFHVPAGATLNVDGDGDFSSAGTFSGRVAFTDQLNASAATFFSRITTGSPTSVILADGEFAVMAHSGTSAVIAFRSGATTYQVPVHVASVL